MQINAFSPLFKIIRTRPGNDTPSASPLLQACGRRRVGLESGLCERIVAEDKGWGLWSEGVAVSEAGRVHDREAGAGGHSNFRDGSVSRYCWGQNSDTKLTRVKNSWGPSLALLPHGMTRLYFQICEQATLLIMFVRHEMCSFKQPY